MTASNTVTTTTTFPTCNYCGLWHPGVCPRVAEIEYYEDGTVKRVKLNPPAAPAPLPYIPYTPPQPFEPYIWPKPGDTLLPPVKITWSDGSAAVPAGSGGTFTFSTN